LPERDPAGGALGALQAAPVHEAGRQRRAAAQGRSALALRPGPGPGRGARHRRRASRRGGGPAADGRGAPARRRARGGPDRQALTGAAAASRIDPTLIRARFAVSFGESLDLDLVAGEEAPPATEAVVVPQDVHLILGDVADIEDTRETPEQVLAATAQD